MIQRHALLFLVGTLLGVQARNYGYGKRGGGKKGGGFGKGKGKGYSYGGKGGYDYGGKGGKGYDYPPGKGKGGPTQPSGSLVPGVLIDPCNQPIFKEIVPNPLDPSFVYHPNAQNKLTVQMCKSETHKAGLFTKRGYPLHTKIYGYQQKGGHCTWPGRTFMARTDEELEVTWENKIPIEPYLLTSRDGVPVLDTNLHWAYNVQGTKGLTTGKIEDDGVPVVTHVHGGHSDSPFDGGPEFFFGPNQVVQGPQYEDPPGNVYTYQNDQPAGTVWYHDHALGITRLNVYAGMAGFYIIRDDEDTGHQDNPLDLPAFPYETALAIQDRMFKVNGELFYPAFPGDPAYADFIVGEGADLPPDKFPGGGPTALAEYFGDFMVVNGKIWPKMEVEPRNYRLRLLNGCDSRFLVLQFYKVPLGATDFLNADPTPLEFTVIGSDQSLATSAATKTMLLMETGSRYDVVFNFANYKGHRIIVRNLGPDEPFSGDFDDFMNGHEWFTGFPPEMNVPYCRTDRIMAFDVVKYFDKRVPDKFDARKIAKPLVMPPVTQPVRQVGLFEGTDEFGRLQPLLGTVGPATDAEGDPINWPSTPDFVNAGLTGQMEGTMTWSNPTTEFPILGTTERWEIWNVSADAHPIHLHLVYYNVISRHEIMFDGCTTEDDKECEDADAFGDGTYLKSQPLVQHNGEQGNGFKIVNPIKGPALEVGDEYFENARKDVVTALPGQVTVIEATFDKPGRYVWHCHVLSHEDHEMMRVMEIVEPPIP